MAHNEHTKSNAEAQQKEMRFILGMIRIGIHLGIFVKERGLSLLEGHAVFALIGPVLLFVPGKSELIHMYIVWINGPAVNAREAGTSGQSVSWLNFSRISFVDESASIPGVRNKAAIIPAEQ